VKGLEKAKLAIISEKDRDVSKTSERYETGELAPEA
jgi:hypothetical protein